MEDTGKMTVTEAAVAETAVATGLRPVGGQGYLGEVAEATGRLGQGKGQARGFGPNQVRARVHRRIEHIRPMTYADAEQVAQELKRGAVVVLDLRATRPELAKRILDFSFGVASALEGQVDRHIDRVYVFSRNGALADEERAAIHL
jgi:cell division inhibitor SepF